VHHTLFTEEEKKSDQCYFDPQHLKQNFLILADDAVLYSVLLLLICEAVWYKHHADLCLFQTIMKNLTNHIPVYVQFILQQF